MKKLMILCVTLFLIQTTMRADDDKPIQFVQLPTSSQQFIKKHFSSESIALVKMESDFWGKSYEVIFTNGDKVEFDKKGEWKEIDCRHTALSKDVVPVQIWNYVTKNYPGQKILKIEKEDRGRHEVELSNSLDLTFDSKFNLVDIDD